MSAKVAIEPVVRGRRLPSGRTTDTEVAPVSGTMVTCSSGWKLLLGTDGGSIHSLRFCINTGKPRRSGKSDSWRSNPKSAWRNGSSRTSTSGVCTLVTRARPKLEAVRSSLRAT